PLKVQQQPSLFPSESVLQKESLFYHMPLKSTAAAIPVSKRECAAEGKSVLSHAPKKLQKQN
ncbi:MAG: hypothetical protein PUH02_08315, partial [bacterium]|nr:hypothetical protein [bacterium]